MRYLLSLIFVGEYFVIDFKLLIMICHQRLLNNNYNKNRVIDFMEREQMIKFVIVGDSGVGKSNILSRYVSNEFGKCESTMGC